MYCPVRYSAPPTERSKSDQWSEHPHRIPGKALFLLWALLLAAGVGALSRYDFKGSVPGGLAAHWSKNPLIALDSDRPTLLMFIHPRCPCSAASIAQLHRVLSRYPGCFNTAVLIALPEGVPEGWEEGANLEAASQLPETTLLRDRDGALAQQFRALNSGTVLVFDRTGKRLFSGGITASRGHEGESLGSLALMDIGTGKAPRVDAMPVFGCALAGPQRDVGGNA